MAWLMDYTLTSERKGIEFEHTRYPSSISSAHAFSISFIFTLMIPLALIPLSPHVPHQAGCQLEY